MDTIESKFMMSVDGDIIDFSNLLMLASVATKKKQKAARQYRKKVMVMKKQKRLFLSEVEKTTRKLRMKRALA